MKSIFAIAFALVVVTAPQAVLVSQAQSNGAQSMSGAVVRIKDRTVSLSGGRQPREAVLDDRSTLVDRDGRLMATGTKAIVAQLPAGAHVLVVWTPYWVPDGDGSMTSYYRRAVEIVLTDGRQDPDDQPA